MANVSEVSPDKTPFAYDNMKAYWKAHHTGDLDHRGISYKNRIPFTITMDGNLGQQLQFWVNPAETQWTIGQRATIEKIAGGAVYHEWPQIGIGSQDQTKFDQPVIRFSFQSGIITPYAYQQDINKEVMDLYPPGLANFYDFLGILNQPSITNTGAPNYVNILYLSSVFPNLWLKGFFSPEEGISFTDSAENPYQINSWGATFVVFKSVPALFDSNALTMTFRLFGFTNPRSVANDKPYNQIITGPTAAEQEPGEPATSGGDKDEYGNPEGTEYADQGIPGETDEFGTPYPEAGEQPEPPPPNDWLTNLTNRTEAWERQIDSARDRAASRDRDYQTAKDV